MKGSEICQTRAFQDRSGPSLSNSHPLLLHQGANALASSIDRTTGNRAVIGHEARDLRCTSCGSRQMNSNGQLLKLHEGIFR